ncbi:MAG: hypothetical protein WCK01_01195 [Candidatus Uhrbacteria bacterium]
MLALILSSLPTVGYDEKPTGSMVVAVRDSAWETRVPTTKERRLIAELEKIEARIASFGLISLEEQNLDLTVDVDIALDRIPSRAELVTMAEDAQASDALSRAIRYLDPPHNTAEGV